MQWVMVQSVERAMVLLACQIQMAVVLLACQIQMAVVLLACHRPPVVLLALQARLEARSGQCLSLSPVPGELA